MRSGLSHLPLIPAKAGIQNLSPSRQEDWMPACAGVSGARRSPSLPLIPAKAGIQNFLPGPQENWMPACAGMSGWGAYGLRAARSGAAAAREVAPRARQELS